ncbi:MAG: hypothetical protein Q4F61_03350, partial [Candidatus Saccharibacteria bacterium]|nr:hypothetical protein [Candidatus Saccharibacteria bacterium]
KIRETVTDEYKKWLKEVQSSDDYKKYPDNYNLDFNIDAYIKELSENYEARSNSTDFYFNDTETEKVFAKDL